MYSDWICCDDCERWFHGPCLGLSSRDISKLKGTEKFSCKKSNCVRGGEPSVGDQQEQQNPSTSQRQSSSKTVDEAPVTGVKAIMHHQKERDGKRRFQVLLSDKSIRWVSEVSLGGFANMLQTYCNDVSISPTKHKQASTSRQQQQPAGPVVRVAAPDANDENTNNNDSSDESSTDLDTHSSEDGSTDISDNDSSDYSTDEEGYAGVKAIVDGKKLDNGSRIFQVLFYDKSLRWLPERNLDRSVKLLKAFCKAKKMEQTKLKQPETRVGASSLKSANTNNWATLEEIMLMVQIYGHKDGLEVKIFADELGEQDCIYLVQISTHCFTVLFIASALRCFISDGENTFEKVASSRRLLLSELSGARTFRYVPFYGQTEKDHCASNAAAIAIEFQRLYRSEEEITKIHAPRTILERIRKQLHKEAGNKLKPWQSISKQQVGVTCTECGKRFKGTNRSVLNFHRCQQH